MTPTHTAHNPMALLTADAVERAQLNKGYAAFFVALAYSLYIGFGKSFKASNWLPNFSHIQPLLVDSSVDVAWQPAQKPAFGSYPSQAGGF